MTTIVRIRVKRAFLYEGRFLQPSTELDVPLLFAHEMMNCGRAELPDPQQRARFEASQGAAWVAPETPQQRAERDWIGRAQA